MKAIQVHEFGSPDVLKLEDVADPIPAPGQVVMRVKAIGVNPLEAVMRSGVLMPMPFPYTPGEDAAGVIEAVGEGVTSVKVDDRVYGGKPLAGTYAELALYDATQVYPLPDTIPFSQGAAIYSSYTTAYYALFNRGQGLPGETVLVHGASGGVGIAAVQMAKAAGFRVLGTASSEQGQALVQQAGAHQVFDHSVPKYVQQIAEAMDGKGVDLILEMKGDINLGKDVELIAANGRIVVIGGKQVGAGGAGAVEINPYTLIFQNASILGLYIGMASEAEIAQMIAAIYAGLENGSLRPTSGPELSLAEASIAHEIIQKASGTAGKLIMVP